MTPEASARFEAAPLEVSAARSFVRGVLAGWKVDPGEIVLLANELVTNAVMHARGPFDITLRHTSTRVRVSVRDDNTRLPEIATVPVDALSGRGLAMVAALASDWGMNLAAGIGKTIWFEIEIRPLS